MSKTPWAGWGTEFGFALLGWALLPWMVATEICAQVMEFGQWARREREGGER